MSLSKAAAADGVALAALSLGAFGLFATVTENYVFSETGPNPAIPWLNLQGATAFNRAVGALWNFYFAVFRPLFPPKLFLYVPAFDAYAITYLLLLVAGLAVLSRSSGLRAVLMRCSLVTSSILAVYEVGLTLVSTSYLDMHATNIQTEFGLAWFTNLDLLEVSSVLTLALLAVRFGLKSVRVPPSDPGR